MAREPREFPGDLIYHAYNRGVEGVRLFEEHGEYAAFLRMLAWAQQRTDMRMLAYCLMPTHWHLVLWPRTDEALSRFLRLLSAQHGRVLRESRGSVGRGAVYQGRFKASPVKDDPHLLTLLRYVERNPLRAGLVASACDWPHGSLAQRAGEAAGRHPALSPWPVVPPADWARHVDEAQSAVEVAALRECLHRENPWGPSAWAGAIEARRRRVRRPRGRPPRA